MRLYDCLVRCLAGGVVLAMLVSGATGTSAQVPNSSSGRLDAALVASTVTEVAAIVAREYMDAEAGRRFADALIRGSAGRRYRPQTASQLAERLTRDLFEQSRDKHLAVTLVQRTLPGGTAVPSREEQVRQANAGVQRVEVLPGNVGYLNLTAFWRTNEARDVIATAMSLLARADALILDMRENNGGRPSWRAISSPIARCRCSTSWRGRERPSRTRRPPIRSATKHARYSSSRRPGHFRLEKALRS